MKKLMLVLCLMVGCTYARSDLQIAFDIAEQKLNNKTAAPMTEELVKSIAAKFKKDPVHVALAINTENTRTWLNRFLDQEKKRLGQGAYKQYLSDALEAIVTQDLSHARKTAAVSYLLSKGAAFRQSSSVVLPGKGLLSGPYWIAPQNAGPLERQPVTSLRTMYQKLYSPLGWQSFTPIITRRLTNGTVLGSLLLTNNEKVLSKLILYSLNPDTLETTEIGTFAVPEFTDPIRSLVIYPMGTTGNEYSAVFITGKSGTAKGDSNLYIYTKGIENPQFIGTISLVQRDKAIESN